MTMTRTRDCVCAAALGLGLGWGVPAGVAWERQRRADFARLEAEVTGLVGDLAAAKLGGAAAPPLSSAVGPEPALTPIDVPPLPRGGVARRDTFDRRPSAAAGGER